MPDAPSVHEVHEHLAARRMHCIRRQVELRRDERETANDLLVRAIEGTIDWNDGIESASVTPTITERAMIIHGRARWVMRSTTITIGHNIWIG